MDTVRRLTRRKRHRTLADLLRRLNPVLRGWCNYFRHGVSSRTFSYLDHFASWRIVGWLKKRHVGLNMHTLVRRHLPGWRIRDGGIEMFRPHQVNIERYRYRVGARYRVVAGQAACLYSSMRPSQRVVRMSRRGSGWLVVLLSGVV